MNRLANFRPSDSALVLKILKHLKRTAESQFLFCSQQQSLVMARNMSVGVTYAAAVSTPNGDTRQPQIQARSCSDPDMRSSFESQSRDEIKKKSRRPGAGIRAKTSFRGWSKKGRDSAEDTRGFVQETQRRQGIQSPRSTREEHRPRTNKKEDYVYVLTLKLEGSLSGSMNRMREQYFPRKLNRTPAHLTLFHALPHSQLEALEAGLSAMALRTKPFQITTGGPFRMRQGVGVNVDTGYHELKRLHDSLQSQWLLFLSEQDAGGFRPHWTVMNKVDNDEEVDEAFHAVRKVLASSSCEGQATGVELWKYERGEWFWAGEFTFDGGVEPLAKTQTTVSLNNSVGYFSRTKSSAEAPSTDLSKQRPGLTRGSSMAEAWRSMSFRRKS